MPHFSLYRTAMTTAAVLGAWHATWVVLVGLGWASAVLNFVLKLHFIRVNIQIAPYSATTAFLLVAITASLGGVFGGLFAMIWNSLAKASERSGSVSEPGQPEVSHARP